MVISCSVPTCRNRFQKGGDIQFHSFPLRREDMSRRWAEAIGRHDWMPTKNSFVCSQHFTINDYQIRPGKHKHFLRENAVPSIFSLPIPRKRQGGWKSMSINNSRISDPMKLPFILPNHLEIKSYSPSQSNSSLYETSIDLASTILPSGSGVSITPLKRSRPNTSPDSSTPQQKNSRYPFSNGDSPYKRIRSLQDLPILHPSNNTSVFLTGRSGKPVPSLTPLYPKNESNYDTMENQNGDDEPVDVTQFLSISLQSEDEHSSSNANKPPSLQSSSHNDEKSIIENLRKKYNYMQKELQKRDMTIKSMQYQMREMRKKMDSISIKKILNDGFKGLTYDILENYINNTNLDSCEKTYSSNVKEYAMKLYSVSPEAYTLIRNQFDLPHPANISHWLRSAGENEDKLLSTSPSNDVKEEDSEGEYDAEDANNVHIDNDTFTSITTEVTLEKVKKKFDSGDSKQGLENEYNTTAESLEYSHTSSLSESEKLEHEALNIKVEQED